MNAEQARTRLTEERERLEELGRSVAAEDPDPSDEDIGLRGRREADVATEVETRMEDRGMADDVARQIGEIDAALARVDDGSWGTCTVCGKAIDDERLEALPQAATCRDHM
ncbi:TraR/DksA C4-type zinc finger protein [Actinomycetospora aeridis]|uniref:TraR/DksA C4-type zinc finger protein n=1 Tax=Actinomycetospora aeridis TaxID=3129231 RepID=A0ABU8N2D6_9PSEU